jgi:starvation-inducible DNA-binding protein
MPATRNSLPAKTRKEVVALLNARLADAIDLCMQTKQAHWNVKGLQFHPLHLLFDKIYETNEEAIDLMAERAVTLGGIAEGTIGAVARATTLPAYPVDAADGKVHLTRLARSLAAFGESVREAIDRAEQLEDKGTADLFTEVSREADKSLWLVEAHLPK